ncbi:MAG: NADH-quinone oxidoreductase subunit L, partial [Thaumarchaeota archaeon]|nr:NADH-quinone oxidoreductase subunit L [Nitrososphaerota archaeon]
MLSGFSLNYAPWLCWLFPFIGALLAVLIGREEDVKLKGSIAALFTFLAWVMALLMLPDALTGGTRDIRFAWISLPYGKPVGIGVLVDPLSVIIANIVAFISFLVLVYSIKYMEGEPGQARYWGLMSFFVGGMLLLVLSDNFISFFVGWKIVGLCSYALIGHYYRDERKYWIGGPPPYPFQKPSLCGLKALLVTTFGDVSMLAGTLIIYLYAGTFNFVELFSTTNVWMAKMAADPGVLTLTILLLLGGPIAKSAQFPLHTWLPEAMAGPTPVSALIHAATMVKAGVFIVARLFPIFFSGYWVNGFSEAYTFFPVLAVLGAVTAFLTAAEAMAALELKKILAYSTMSQIGYMMLGLGVAGMSANAALTGYVGGIFHLLSHALFKAALFLAAGVILHATGSIYIHEKALSRK